MPPLSRDSPRMESEHGVLRATEGGVKTVSFWDDRQISDLASLIRVDGAGVPENSISVEGFVSLITFGASKEG